MLEAQFSFPVALVKLEKVTGTATATFRSTLPSNLVKITFRIITTACASPREFPEPPVTFNYLIEHLSRAFENERIVLHQFCTRVSGAFICLNFFDLFTFVNERRRTICLQEKKRKKKKEYENLYF